MFPSYTATLEVNVKKLTVSILALIVALAVAAARTAFGGNGRGAGANKQVLLQAAASYIGVTEAEIRSARAGGQSLAQLAVAEGKTVAGLSAALVAAGNASIDRALAAERITAAQASSKKAALPAQVQSFINATGALARGGCRQVGLRVGVPLLPAALAAPTAGAGDARPVPARADRA